MAAECSWIGLYQWTPETPWTVLAISFYMAPFATAVTFVLPVTSLAVSCPVTINSTVKTTTCSWWRSFSHIFTWTTRTTRNLQTRVILENHKFTYPYARFSGSLINREILIGHQLTPLANSTIMRLPSTSLPSRLYCASSASWGSLNSCFAINQGTK